MQELTLPPNTKIKRPRAKQSAIRRPLTIKEINEIADLGPCCLDGVATPVDPLAVHSRRFSGTRRTRLMRVQQMSLLQQNAYYRTLGFFK